MVPVQETEFSAVMLSGFTSETETTELSENLPIQNMPIIKINVKNISITYFFILIPSILWLLVFDADEVL